MSNSKRKVAIFQNRIQPGGRFQVMAQMIAVLNKMDIEPDLLCFRNRLDFEKVNSFYSKELRYNIRKVSGEWPMPFEWNILWFNIAVSKYLKDYHFSINHNNTSFGLKTDRPIISYTHYPRKARLESALKDIHLPEMGKAPIFNSSKDLLNMVGFLYKRNNHYLKNDILVANSEFTKKAICDSYPSVKPEEVAVIYPPVDVKLTDEKKESDKNTVVSLGRFSTQKRQLEQIFVAEGLAHMQFILMGFVGEQAYFEECQNYVEAHGLKNVRIIANVSKEEIRSTLKKARFFIHSMRNEPFGITTVQAITAGCIPIVHDSGGQREIVQQQDLRYQSGGDAIALLKKVSSEDDHTLNKRLSLLKESAKKFSGSEFDQKFRELLLSLPYES